MVESGAPDFPDALVSAIGREAGCTYSVTFDRKAAGLPGMRLLNG